MWIMKICGNIQNKSEIINKVISYIKKLKM